jgi:hypothetical protein
MQIKKLKELIRKTAKGNTLSAETISEITTAIGE